MSRYVAVIILGVSLVFAVKAQVQDQKRATGLWELTISPKENPSSSLVHRKFLLIRKAGNSLIVKDPQNNKEIQATENTKDSKTEIVFPISITDSTGEKNAEMKLTAIKPDALSGDAVIDGQKYVWVAGPLARIWACSNHKPNHTTKDPAEIKELTRQFQCTGWHPLKGDPNYNKLPDLIHNKSRTP